MPFATLFPAAAPRGLDLLARLLALNPARRIGVADALWPPFFASLYSDADMADSVAPPLAPVASFDALQALPIEGLRELIRRDVRKFRPDEA